jgi:transcriptional regulator
MYLPAHFHETRPEILQQAIAATDLAILVTMTEAGMEASHIPLLYDPQPAADGSAPHGTLYGHLARANRQWQRFQPEIDAMAIFQGPDAYITPSWYETKRETGKVVPTWNYAIVQVRGTVRVIEDSEWIAQQITELTVSQEGGRSAPWAVTDAPATYIQSQIKGIVGLEITVTGIEGKWKVSQNRPVADRVGVAEGLQGEASNPAAPDMAGLVRAWGGIDGN